VVPVVEFLAQAMKPHLTAALAQPGAPHAAPVTVSRPDREPAFAHG
jgi:DNA (cytosine-5)-methyltransferase 1